MPKNPFGITERKFKKDDYRFFYNMIVKTMKPYVSQYYKFDPASIETSFANGFPELKMLMKGKRRIGFYQIHKDDTTLELIKIFFTSTYQGKGMGSWYMLHFETLGYKRIVLQVWENNPAKLFYKKLGYKQVMKKKHKIHMEKTLG